MQDARGVFYYPFPADRHLRMYVRAVGGEICFRMWRSDDARLWDDHGWVPYAAIQAAQALYSGKGMDPKVAYDLTLAQAVLAEAAGSGPDHGGP